MSVKDFRWIEYTPKKWTVHSILGYAHDGSVPSTFSGYTFIHRKIMTVTPYHLICNTVKRLNVKYKELMHRHCGTNNIAPQWTFTILANQR